MNKYEAIKRMSMVDMACEIKSIIDSDTNSIYEIVEMLNSFVDLDIEKLDLTVNDYNLIKRGGINKASELLECGIKDLKNMELTSLSIAHFVNKGYVTLKR